MHDHHKYLILEMGVSGPTDFESPAKMKVLEEKCGYKVKRLKKSNDSAQSPVVLPQGAHCVFVRTSGKEFPGATVTHTVDGENTLQKVLDNLIEDEQQKRQKIAHQPPAATLPFFNQSESRASVNDEKKPLLEQNKNGSCCTIL